MILLDTNILSELMKTAPDASVLKWMNSYPASKYYISAITKGEIELGIALLPDGKRKIGLKTGARLMFEEFPERCLAFDSAAAANYAIVVSRRTGIGRPVSVEDAQIAAIALTHNMLLATRNTKDFEGIDGLRIINPWSQP